MLMHPGQSSGRGLQAKSDCVLFGLHSSYKKFTPLSYFKLLGEFTLECDVQLLLKSQKLWQPWPPGLGWVTTVPQRPFLFVTVPTSPEISPPSGQVSVAIYHYVFPVDFLFGDLRRKGIHFLKLLLSKAGKQNTDQERKDRGLFFEEIETILTCLICKQRIQGEAWETSPSRAPTSRAGPPRDPGAVATAWAMLRTKFSLLGLEVCDLLCVH